MSRASRAAGPAPIAYVMSRFPKLTETFVLFEILALEELGADVRVYPLLRERQAASHPEAADVVARARFFPFLSLAILRSNAWMLAHRPRAWAGALATLVRETFGSANYLLGGLAIFPKVVHMARDMERAGVGHVHCHFSNHPAMAGFVIHRLTGIPFSFTAHGSDLHVDRHMLCRKVSESTFTVTISEYNRRLIRATCGPLADDRVRVIHTGVDTTVFVPRTGERPTQPFTMLSVGTLHEVKGQAHLVAACRLLAGSGIDFRCGLVGEGPDEARLRRAIAAAGLADRVTLLGRRTRPEIAALMRAADVVVAPSVPTAGGRREGIPVVLMEAMASGVPVVASRLSGIPELVEHGRTGLLVEAGDVPGIAAALRELHDDAELRSRLGTAGRERVLASFDIRRNAARVLEAIVQAGRPAPARRMPERRPGRGFSVALVGPDGAGKSSVARRLARELRLPTSYVYMGVNPASGNHLLPTTRLVAALRRRFGGEAGGPGERASERPPGSLDGPSRQARGGAARAILRLANRLAEEWYRQAIVWRQVRRGDVVILDRHYFLDYHATDIAPRRIPPERRIHGAVLRRLYPRPDMVVLLDAPADVLLARKGEGTLESLERMRSEYVAAGRDLAHFRIVDASAPESQVVKAVRDAIQAFARDRSDRLGDVRPTGPASRVTQGRPGEPLRRWKPGPPPTPRSATPRSSTPGATGATGTPGAPGTPGTPGTPTTVPASDGAARAPAERVA